VGLYAGVRLVDCVLGYRPNRKDLETLWISIDTQHLHMDDMVGGYCVCNLFDYLLAVSEREHTTEVSLSMYPIRILHVDCHHVLTGSCYRSFAFYFTILTTWALQVQFLLQIIINRCSILLPDKRAARRLKFYVALFITAINISVYCIWVPARLQISERYIHINEFWDRTEKVIYLLVDAGLNLYFIIIVKRVSLLFCC